MKLLDSDPGRGVMLLERLLPGTSLLELDDDSEATRIAAGVMARLKTFVPPGSSFPSMHSFPNLSINYVAPATRIDGTQVVLKAGVPNPEIHTEY